MIGHFHISDNHGVIKKCKPSCPEYKNESTVRIMTLEGIPIAQQRPRARILKMKPPKKDFVQIYTVNSKHKKQLQKLLVQRPIFEVATFVYVLALYTPPQSWSGPATERAMGTRKVTKPDGTNILKFYEDLLEGNFMPKDQFANPTMVERFYSNVNMLIYCTVATDQLKFNLPRVIKKHYLNQLFV